MCNVNGCCCFSCLRAETRPRGSPVGPEGSETTHETAAVLHFTYNRFSDLKSRRDRCDCAPTDADAKRCFILPFDRMVPPPPPPRSSGNAAFAFFFNECSYQALICSCRQT